MSSLNADDVVRIKPLAARSEQGRRRSPRTRRQKVATRDRRRSCGGARAKSEDEGPRPSPAVAVIPAPAADRAAEASRVVESCCARSSRCVGRAPPASCAGSDRGRRGAGARPVVEPPVVEPSAGRRARADASSRAAAAIVVEDRPPPQRSSRKRRAGRGRRAASSRGAGATGAAQARAPRVFVAGPQIGRPTPRWRPGWWSPELVRSRPRARRRHHRSAPWARGRP
jgi:hypothetical protein